MKTFRTSKSSFIGELFRDGVKINLEIPRIELIEFLNFPTYYGIYLYRAGDLADDMKELCLSYIANVSTPHPQELVVHYMIQCYQVTTW